jgi:hypothetical protein
MHFKQTFGACIPIAIDPETLKIVATGQTLKQQVDAGLFDRASDDWLPQGELHRIKWIA